MGEVVPDALETGLSKMGAWDGREHANTMPRLAEELPYKDGLLAWTEENVGELFACIAYKHLTNVKDEVDREEAEDNANEIKQAVMAQGVDGGLCRTWRSRTWRRSARRRVSSTAAASAP